VGAERGAAGAALSHTLPRHPSLSLPSLPTMASPPPPAAPTPTVDPASLQRCLDHDNYGTRDALKEMMKDPIFVP